MDTDGPQKKSLAETKVLIITKSFHFNRKTLTFVHAAKAAKV
jgi:hypothetical protein